MSNNVALEDEIEAVNAIYDTSVLEKLNEHTALDDSVLCTLRLPSNTHISLRISFPSTYPDRAPTITGTQSVDATLPKGSGANFSSLVSDILAGVFRPGEPCIFDLVEEVSTLIVREAESETSHHGTSADHTEETSSNEPEVKAEDNLGPEPPWIISETVIEKKSVFVARAAKIESPEQAKGYLRYLIATDKKVAKATHNISAWRIRALPGSSGSSKQHQHQHDTGSVPEATYQDCDSDGETAAGGRLLHLLQLMDVWNVMVVVSRWYGGTQLGPDRFRIINQVARDAIVRGGWIEDTHGKKKKK